jgi:hypothetical protein
MGYPLKSNSIIKAYKSEEYDIDIFAAIDESFRGVVQAGSSVRDTADK